MRYLYLAPDHDVDPTVLSAVAVTLSAAFRLPMSALAPTPTPMYAYDERRRQFGSSLILRVLSDRIPADAVRVLAITECDLFIPMLTFVFGQAQLSGPVALVSLARLRQEHYGLPPDAFLLRERGCKECLHELGHSFGLTHCGMPGCVMSLSTTIEQVDRKTPKFCYECRAQLDSSLSRLHATPRRGGAK